MKVKNIWKSEEQQHHSSSTLCDSSQYPDSSLIGLPIELIRKIVQNLEVKDWLNLCRSCKYFNQLVNKFFLYHDVKIKDIEKLIKFKKTLSKNKKTNILSLYVNKIEFIHPIKEKPNIKTNIAGFQYEDYEYDRSETYIGLMLEVISFLPNISEIGLFDISPGFQFPEWSSTLKTYAHEHNYYPSIRTLRLSSKEESSIALRPNLLWSFGLIEELILDDIVIDSNSLAKPHLLTVTNENGPFLNRYDLNFDNSKTWSPIERLSLISCSIASNGTRHLEQYFKEVKTLKLLSLKSYYDILLSNCFPSLVELHIDLNSKCFSFYDQQEINSINSGNINSNLAYFNSKFVPKFYLNYKKFVEILEKLPNNVEKIYLINVSFTNIIPVDPEKDNDETNLVNNNLFEFLDLLKQFNSIEFVLLRNYKLHQTRNYEDWENLLSPCFTPINSIRVKDKDGSVLFSRNEKY